MLLIRPTRSLARRLGIKLDLQAKVEARPALLTEWYANDFRLGRAEFVLFTNPETLLPVIMKAAPYRDLATRFQNHLPEYLQELGWPDAPTELAPRFTEGTQFFPTEDRSVLGVMVQFIKELEIEHYLGRADLNNPRKMSLRLSETLIGGARAGGYQFPIEMFLKALGLDPKVRKRHGRTLYLVDPKIH